MQIEINKSNNKYNICINLVYEFIINIINNFSHIWTEYNVYNNTKKILIDCSQLLFSLILLIINIIIFVIRIIDIIMNIFHDILELYYKELFYN